MNRLNSLPSRWTLTSLLAFLLLVAPLSIQSVPVAGPTAALAAGCDINNDGVVNLSDIGIFAQDYYGVYNPRSDLNGDGIINLSDLGILAQCL